MLSWQIPSRAEFERPVDRVQHTLDHAWAGAALSANQVAALRAAMQAFRAAVA